MKQLIIDGVDWLDPRMIGVIVLDVVSQRLIKIISIEIKEDGVILNDVLGIGTLMGNYWHKNCRIAQGEKTAWDGKGGQPVPDGIFLTIRIEANGSSTAVDGYSQDVEWEYVTHYQIQEMPEQEAHKRVFEYDGAYHCLDCDAKWGALPNSPEEPDECMSELNLFEDMQYVLKRMSKDEQIMRRRLALAYQSIFNGYLYGDDGELQLRVPELPMGIDFMRESLSGLDRKISDVILLRYKDEIDNPKPKTTTITNELRDDIHANLFRLRSILSVSRYKGAIDDVQRIDKILKELEGDQ